MYPLSSPSASLRCTSSGFLSGKIVKIFQRRLAKGKAHFAGFALAFSGLAAKAKKGVAF